MGLALSEADIRALEERTEGWIAGLQLAALALQASPDTSSGDARSSFIARLSGSHRFILSYLTEEVLNRQPSETRRFLLQTSFLDRLSGDLCDAVTGRSDSRELLESLYNANLFLVPLDDEGRWYRYHHLFADLLRDLQQAQHKDECTELHRRASHWYAQSEAGSERFVFTDEAVRHALAAGDSAQVLSLLESRVVEMLIQGYAKTVAGWLRAIPEGWAIQSPRANLAFAWMHLLRGDFTQAAPFVERLQAQFGAEQSGTGLGDAHPDPSLEAEWLALQAMLLNMQGRSAESLELGKAALKLLPEGHGYVRSLIYMAQAGAYQSLDDYPNAKQSFEMLIQHARAGGNSVSELLGISALLQMTIMHGELHFAYELAAQTVERLERSGRLPPVSAAAYGALGHICHQWYQLEQVHSSFKRAIQVSALGGYSDAEISYALIRSRLRQVEGDLQAAADEFQKAAELARRIAPAWVREEIISQQVRLALAQDQLTEAEAALQRRWLCQPGQVLDPGSGGGPENHSAAGAAVQLRLAHPALPRPELARAGGAPGGDGGGGEGAGGGAAQRLLAGGAGDAPAMRSDARGGRGCRLQPGGLCPGAGAG